MTGSLIRTKIIFFCALALSACKLQLNHQDSAGADDASVSTSGTTPPVTLATVAISSPAASSWVNAAGAASLTVSGTCSEDGSPVTISGSGSASTSCAGGAFSVNVDVSAASDGAITLLADHSNATQASVALNKDVLAATIPAWVAPAAVANTGAASYAFSWAVATDATSGLDASPYLVETFANGNCSGAAASSAWQAGTGYTYNGLTAGSIYSVRISTKDLAGNVSATSCSSAVSRYASLTVNKVYSSYGDWNDYVKDSNLAADQYTQNGTACDGTETGPYTCIHGGELRRVAVPGQTSCTGLTLTDYLGAFDWECQAVGGVVKFFSKGLKAGKGLKDLVDASAWKDEKVYLYSGASLIGQSAVAVWWSNTVTPLPDNSSTATLLLDGTDDDGAGPDAVFTAGTIFTLAASRATPGYELGLDRMGLVTLGTATLSYDGSGTANCGGAGEVCLVFSGANLFPNQLWFEGKFNGLPSAGTTAKHLVRPWSTYLTTIRNSTLSNATETGIYLRWGKLNHLRDLTITSTPTFAIGSGDWDVIENVNINGAGQGIGAGENATVRGCRISNGTGVGINSNTGGTILNCTLTNNVYDATHPDGLNSTWVGLTVTNTNRHGVSFRSGGESRATMTHFTSANNLFPFNIRQDGDYMTAVNGAIMNEDISLDGDNNKFANIAFSGTLTTYATTVDATFSQNLLFNTGAQCDTTDGTNPGLSDGSCGLQGASTHSPHAGIVVTSAVNGKVTSDTANTTDTNGTATYSASLLDWFNFDSFFRGWGRDGALAFPDASNIANCDGTTTNCVIWDWRPKTNDTILKNRTGNGTSAAENEPFVAGQACPTAASGNRAISDSQQREYYPNINALEDNAAAGGDDDGFCETGEKCYNRFLVNAVEIIGDRNGDEDGLCETGEACIYSPNFGAYQGTGDYMAGGTCTFQNGLVTNVTLYAYPTN